MAGTGRNVSDAIGSIPADQVSAFEAARTQIEPAAEEYVTEAVLPKVKAAFDEIKHYRGDRPTPGLEDAVRRFATEVKRIPGEIVAEMASPIGTGIAGHNARKAWSEVRAKAQMSEVARTFGPVDQALAVRSLLDGTAAKLLQAPPDRMLP